jgi:hypothetical protein
MFGAIDENGGWLARDKAWIEQKPMGQDGFGGQPHMATADFNFDGMNELLVAHPVNRENQTSDGFIGLLYLQNTVGGIPGFLRLTLTRMAI